MGKSNKDEVIFVHEVSCIDLAELNAAGAMKVGKITELQRGLPNGYREEVQVQRYDDCLNTHHEVFDQSGHKIQTFGGSFEVVQTGQKFGGMRNWFVCAGCEQKKRKLYYKNWGRCRQCLNLRYPCQHDGEIESKVRQIKKLERRLTAYGEFPNRYCVRPKGMHHKTYKRLSEQIHKLWREYEILGNALVEDAEKKLKRLKDTMSKLSSKPRVQKGKPRHPKEKKNKI